MAVGRSAVASMRSGAGRRIRSRPCRVTRRSARVLSGRSANSWACHGPKGQGRTDAQRPAPVPGSPPNLLQGRGSAVSVYGLLAPRTRRRVGVTGRTPPAIIACERASPATSIRRPTDSPALANTVPYRSRTQARVASGATAMRAPSASTAPSSIDASQISNVLSPTVCARALRIRFQSWVSAGPGGVRPAHAAWTSMGTCRRRSRPRLER